MELTEDFLGFFEEHTLISYVGCCRYSGSSSIPAINWGWLVGVQVVFAIEHGQGRAVSAEGVSGVD